MKCARVSTVLAMSIGLIGCQTVNGIDVRPHPAQGESFCERNLVLCVVGGAAFMGGVALAASGHRGGSGAMGTGGGY